MNREEILERNKNSNTIDEGKQFIEDKSRNIGEAGIILFFVILALYKKWKEIPSEDLLGLFWGYLSFTYIGKYKYYRTKKHLIVTIVGLIGAIAFTVSYILKTW